MLLETKPNPSYRSPVNSVARQTRFRSTHHASEKGRQSLNQRVSSYAAVALAPAAKPSGSEATVNGARATADKRKSDSRQRVSGGVPGGVAGGVPGGVAGGIGRGNGTGPGAGPGIGVLSPEDQKRQQLLSRLHPSIAGLLERLKDKNSKPTTDEARFVRDGKAEIQVWLSVKTPQAIAALKRLGFEIVLDQPSSKMVIGRVPLEKLAALAETNLIRYIAPMTSTGN